MSAQATVSGQGDRIAGNDTRLEWLPHVLAAALVAVAFGVGVATTADLSWPPRQNFAREMGSTNSILADRAMEDPAYLGEARWYNPLVPYVVAGASRLLDLPVNEAFTRLGPYLNLLTPLGFYALSTLLFGRWVAFAALAVFLFSQSALLPPNTEGTYSPWLWTRSFVQGPTLFGACAIVIAFRRSSPLWDVGAGILLGVVFLGHTGPALVLVLLTLLLAARGLFGDEAPRVRWSGVAIRVTTIGATSLAISLPYLWPLFSRYRFQVLNRAPLEYVGLSIPEFLGGFVSLGFLAGAVGAWVLIRDQRSLGVTTRGRDEFLLLLAAALLPFGYGLLHQAAKHVDIALPILIPAHNFHVYYKDFEAMLAGLGFVHIARVVAGRLPVSRAVRLAPERVALLLLLVVVVGAQSCTYLGGHDLVAFRRDAIEKGERRDLIELHEWILANTSPDDVFLTDDWFALQAVSSAARKVVVTYSGYSNPYVEFESRHVDRQRLFDLLRAGDSTAFLALAARYDLDYVIAADAAMECCRLEAAPEGALEPVLRAPGLTLYRVLPLTPGA